MPDGLLANAAPVEDTHNQADETQDGGQAEKTPEDNQGNEPHKEEPEDNTPRPGPEDGPPVDAPGRPDWLPEQFWDQKKGADTEKLAKSYAKLRTDYNKRNNDTIGETDDDYMLPEYFTEQGNFKADNIVIPKDDPMLVEAYKAARATGLGVKQTNEFIAAFMSKAAEFAPPEIDVDAEREKLGKNAPHVIAGIKTWIDGMAKQGLILPESQKELIRLGATAAGIKALDFLRQKSGEQRLPGTGGSPGSPFMTKEDWYAATYKENKLPGESRAAYNDRMHEIGKKIFGEGKGNFEPPPFQL